MKKINVYLMDNEYIPQLSTILNNSEIEKIGILVSDYQNIINPQSIYNSIIKNIGKYIDYNGFSKDETKILMQKLLPKIEGIGAHTVKIINSRIELTIKLGKENELSEMLSEYEKTKKAINEIRTNLFEGINTKYINPLQNYKDRLSIRQIALKYAYEGQTITRQNGDEIAAKYGHNSGERLYQYFNKFYRPIDRTGNPGTLQKLKNKIKLIESVINLLPKDKQARAKDELSVLKTIQSKEYI